MALFQGLGSKNNQNQPSKGNANGRGITVKSVLRYSMMPEILPRIRALGFHFGHFAYLLAMVFASARLLPKNHPVMNPANMGQYGVRQVIAMAANNIKWSKDNIDQIAIFSAIVIGLIMIVIQAVLIMIAAVIGANPASAQDISGIFSNANPAEDPIMIFFAQVFGGLNDFWGAGVSANAPGVNSGLQEAVHSILALYSTAMMVIAVIIIVYYIMSVVAEAAKTGTPFGNRFNSLYAPLRLVIALGLLVPLGSGLNTAQYITLWVAKTGSNLGNSVWQEFSESLADKSSNYELSKFETPWVRDVAARIFFMEVCKAAENKYNQNSNVEAVFETTTDDSAGVYGFNLEYKDSKKLLPTKCGRIDVSLSVEKESMIANEMSASAEKIAEVSEKMVKKMTDDRGVIAELAKEYADSEVAIGGRMESAATLDVMLTKVMEEADKVEQEILDQSIIGFQDLYEKQVEKLHDKMNDSWVYAGVWYLEFGRLLQANKDITAGAIPNTAAGSVKGSDHFFYGQVGTEDLEADSSTFNSSYHLSWVKRVSNQTETAVKNATVYYFENIGEFLNKEDLPSECRDIGESSGIMSKIACAIVAQLVPDNIVILANEEYKDIDPMTSLINAGYEITQRSFTFFLWGVGLKAASGASVLFGKLGPIVKTIADPLAGILFFLGAIGIGAGLILYFILPIMPFIYFFFAIFSWAMEIFEAIVAMPLWALGHLRIDGDGLPGSAASQGYYLLFAIFIRPLLIVISLIGGVLLFSAGVYLLQQIFFEVIEIKGMGSVNRLEVMFYTLSFAYISYTIGLTCFKLVDTVPNNILRWIGSGAQTFSDGRDVDLQGNIGIASAAAGYFGSQSMGMVGKAVSGGTGSVANKLKKGLEGDNKSISPSGSSVFENDTPEQPSAPSGNKGPGSGGTGPGGGLSEAARRSLDRKRGNPKKDG